MIRGGYDIFLGLSQLATKPLFMLLIIKQVPLIARLFMGQLQVPFHVYGVN